MDMQQILVLAVGIALVGFILWFFFGKRDSVRVVAKEGAQEIQIDVLGGYEPSTIELKLGVPTRLVFHRRETASCSEEVVIPDFGVRRKLPAHRKTVVEFTPDRSGRFAFTCGMGMLRGTLIVGE